VDCDHNWEDHPTVRDLVPTGEGKRNPENFAQRRLSSGAHIYCTVKPRFPEWCLSHRIATSESQYQASLGCRRVLFSLDMLVKSSEYLGSKGFSDYVRLWDWFEESNPNPRGVLLSNPQWRRESKNNPNLSEYKRAALLIYCA
jgi:hypothetical protein